MRKKLHKILVTGAAGFIGSEFVRQGVKAGHKIVVVDKLTYAGDLERLKNIKGKFSFYKTDICNLTRIEQIFKKEKPQAVIHFSAESHVDRSIHSADSFLETNIKGTHVLLDASRRHNIDKFIQVSCYDEKTRALTTEGLKTYKELKKGDLVFSLNPATKRIELKPIEKVIVQQYKGDMIHFKNKRIDLLVTPNHKMFLVKPHSRNIFIEAAIESYKRSIFFMPSGHWDGKNEEFFDLKGHGCVKTKDLLYILGIFIGDGFVAYQEKSVKTKTGLPRKQFLETARDTKGRFKTIKKVSEYMSTCRAYRVFFDIPENDKCRKRVEEVLARMNIKYHCHKGKAGTHLYFSSRVLMNFFAQCGRGAKNKHIPRWALEYSPEYLKVLFEGLMDSDGYNGKIYHTISERLMANICELGIKLNFKPSVGKRHSVSFVEGRKIEGSAYCISFGRTMKSISRHRNKIINYDGNIWCLKVKDNKNFIVERNGKLDFCGNTDEVYGDIKRGKFSETSLINPSSPYSASKAAADCLVKSYVRTYDFPAVIIRPSNNYGPWQYPEKFMPVVIYKALKNQPIPVYGKGLNKREWLYVSDCAKAVFLVLRKGKLGEVYNVGSSTERKNIDVARKVLRILGKPVSLIKFVQDRPGHDYRYALNFSKISRLGWRPEIDFETGVLRTIDWYKENIKWLEKKVKYLKSYWKKVYK